MNGSYEQVPAFRFKRRKVFEVVDQGIVLAGRTWEWREIKDISHFKGVGSIRFYGRPSLRIHMNSFRKTGEKGHFSLFGDNPTFNKLRSHWIGNRLEQNLLRNPEYVQLQQEADQLLSGVEQLTESLSEEDAVKAAEKIGRKIALKHLKMRDISVIEAKRHYNELRDERRKKDAVLLPILVIVIFLFWWFGYR